MRWMIASDIHGSAYYCRKMIKHTEEKEADKLFASQGYFISRPKK